MSIKNIKTPQSGGRINLMIVAGAEGACVYLNDFRIAGPKPWGGGTVIKSWEVAPEDLESAIEDWFQRKPQGRPRRQKKRAAVAAKP